MATLATVIDQVQAYMRTLSGIRAAPDEMPERVNVFPFVIARPGDGTWEFGADGTKKGLHNIVVELHVARKDLPRDIATALPYCDSVPNLLMNKLLNDNKWNGTIDTFRDITYRFTVWEWSPELKTIGFEFTIHDVKVQSTIT